ncbi:MAG TPA: ABC transporter ATP-binding protein [Solirubrobacteraceae bacterium]|nr:ABC transporter ATP-binding protein [Solirubrobacteraceae bacterium]
MRNAFITNGKRDAPQMHGSRREQLALLLGESRWKVVRLAIYSIISGLTEAATLGVLAQIATSLVKGSKHVHVDIVHVHFQTTLPTLIEIAFALTIVRLIMQVPLSLLPARIAADVQMALRTKVYDAFTRASWEIQSKDREGQLQELMSKQVAQATGGALQATSLMTSVFTFLVLLAAAIALNPIAALVVGTLSIAMFGLLRPIRSQGVRSARALSKAQVAYAGAIAESIRLAQEMQVFGVNDAQRTRIGRYVAKQNRLFYRTQVLLKLSGNVYQSLIYILLVAGIAGLYLAGGGRSATIGGVILVLLRAGTTGQGAQTTYQGLAQSLPFIERTQHALQRYLDNQPPDGGEPLSGVSEVAFDNVSFSYNPGRPVLRELSFKIPAGEVIGIVGPSGAGKSTLVQLLLRLRSPGEGTYLINGQPADSFSRADWHRQIAFVPQEPRLLHASVADNIRFYRKISDEDVERAAQLARIHDDIASWPDGYKTIVGPRADAVSGGQQQRICLARALAARPHVLVLDEPTSSLDPHSEHLIGESLKALRSELTLFIIAHRMSTLDICDRVMVIVDGRLAGFDTKALLQATNEYYRHASQLALGSTA